MIPWKVWKCVAWDATCVDTFAPTYLPFTSSTAGAAASKAEDRKVIKYTCLMDEFHFVPVAFETFGPWGNQAKAFLSTIGRKITDHTGEKRASAFLFQRLSIAIQRGNAASILGTIPKSAALDEIFLLV